MGFKLTPSVSIAYNSQAREGWVGFGWDIQGLSAITLIGKNPYYHGTCKGADVNATDAKFALDGVPLVQNTQSATMADYPLITASEHILAAPTLNAQGYVKSFTVLYPNGIRATYGFSTSAAYNLPSYPVTEMTDLDGNKIVFQYASDADNGNKRITSIRYGYNASGQYKGEISFSYTNSSAHPVRYYAGKSLYHDYRLTGVTSKDNGTAICQYSLSYEQADNVWLLRQVACTSGGEQFRPLEFEYGAPEYYPPPTEDYLYRDNDNALIISNTFPEADELVYRRGKFVPNGFNDGMLIYPLFADYTLLTSSGGHYQFGSGYPDNQVILFAPSLEDYNSTDTSITTGSGFQTIEAVDVDGDGVDEAVKVNISGVTSSKTKLQNTVYKCSSATGIPQQSSQFEVQVNGVISSGSFISPYRRAYRWGDFLGNGKIQLLAVAYSQNASGTGAFNQTSYAALIDLADHTVICDSQLFSFPLSSNNCLLACDLDNDSKTELCFATSSGLNVYRIGTSTFSLAKTLTGVTSSILSSSDRPCFITDLNGDGYIDIMRAPVSGTATSWDRYAFNGVSFVNTSVSLTSRSSSDEFMFIDVNQDGLADLVKISGASLGTYMNLNGASFGAFQQSPTSLSDTKGIVPCNVVDYTGMSSFIKVDGHFIYPYKYTRLSPKRRHLTKSVDSLGRMLLNSYEYLPLSSLYWTDSSFSVDNEQGYAFRTLPIYVLEKEEAYLTDYTYADMYRCVYYNYFNGVVHSLGLGFCGFSMIRSYDFTSGVATTIVDEKHNPQKRGVVTAVDTRYGSESATPYNTVRNTYDNNSTTYGKLNPRLTESIVANTLTGITTTTTYTYGSYDQPIDVQTTRSAGIVLWSPDRTERLTYVYNNSVSPAKYVLGVVTQETLTKGGDGLNDYVWRERTVNTYDSNFHRLSSENYTRSVTIPELVSFAPPVTETRWQYDSYGNIISKKTAHYGAEEFVGDTLTYDSAGRYMLTRTDAFGHTTSYGGYNKFGKPASATDYRGRVTTYTYDAWGNLISATNPDGTAEQTSRSWGGKGLYTVGKTITGRPETVTHYDALGRELRSGVKRFDGQWQFTDREYDVFGRLSRTSLPFRDTAATYWNTYTYDIYGRPTALTEASGKVTTWSFNGASTTTVKDGISSTITTDPAGNVTRVVDAGGAITYFRRDDGQIGSMSVSGGSSTSFTYDDYGRRTQMVDPSAGTQTDSYLWNSDGSSETTHTNANGSVTTHKDKYGRIILVERDGAFNTSYSYDTYGRLSGEQSTNGTAKEYSYDAYDRVATFKESAPGGMWLQKTYSYGPGSVVASVAYTSQDGAITTENYAYANGYNTGITLPDGTLVWSLSSENDLGMATQITSGSITREYGFTAFGMPTFRKMDGGDLQNYSYTFDTATGNLLMRIDAVNGQTETFGYDSLNRLTAIGSRQVSYANNGNILSMDGVGSMAYSTIFQTDYPYRIKTLTTEAGGATVPDIQQTVTYTAFDRPAQVSEGLFNAAFTYNGEHQRVKMRVKAGVSTVLDRYYLGDCYEFDDMPDSTAQRLYLGGDAYSAPMVYVQEDEGDWTAYNIGRDYLGNITHIATLDGTPVAEYSYDPWGRLRDPQTLEIYTSGSEPDLFLGRGFTGHEHLPLFGLVNMNARLYDPLLGRFLSPDPFIQAPDFTQNFNRYAYALNNPLKYSDESGEFIVTTALIVGASIGLLAGAYSGYRIGLDKGASGWSMAGYIVGGGLIGGLAGLAAGYVGGAVSAGVGLGGFWGGAISGGASGAVAGAINGFGMTLLSGKGINDAFGQMISQAGIGAASGALIGGVVGGIAARIDGKSFWTGRPDIIPSRNSTNQNSPLSKTLDIQNEQLTNDTPLGYPKKFSYDTCVRPNEPSITLYRGTTGTEYSDTALYMTDNPYYAAEYIKDGGSVVKVTLPKLTLELMENNGDVFLKTGYYMVTNDFANSYIPHTEYMFPSWIKPFIVQLFTPL